MVLVFSIICRSLSQVGQSAAWSLLKGFMDKNLDLDGDVF